MRTRITPNTDTFYAVVESMMVHIFRRRIHPSLIGPGFKFSETRTYAKPFEEKRFNERSKNYEYRLEYCLI